MTKQSRKGTPITERDLTEFVAGDSDFAFEMQVLKRLRDLNFSCSHSGTYRDPVKDKVRQFDIRAVFDDGPCTLALAVECKNLRLDRPLLVSAVPRTEAEAFHQMIFFEGGSVSAASIRPVEGRASVYVPGEMVGKKTDQVYRDQSGLHSDDVQAFEKVTQAVNSCEDLVREFVLKPDPPLRRVVLPVLVVPSNLLWQVDYTAEGHVEQQPRCVHRATLFLRQSWGVDRGAFGKVHYCLSHIEIVTLDFLADAFDIWLGPKGFSSQAR